jgi:hypothetical protein
MSYFFFNILPYLYNAAGGGWWPLDYNGYANNPFSFNQPPSNSPSMPAGSDGGAGVAAAGQQNALRTPPAAATTTGADQALGYINECFSIFNYNKVHEIQNVHACSKF